MKGRVVKDVTEAGNVSLKDLAHNGIRFFNIAGRNMINTFFEKQGFKWVDVLSPGIDEMNALAAEYGIHPEFIADALQPEHLPKYEPVANTSFFIVRYYAPDRKHIDTIQGLTNKIAIFQTEGLLLTIHLHKIDFLEHIRDAIVEKHACRSTIHLLNKIFKAVLRTFEDPASELAADIDRYEEKAFLKKSSKLSLSGVYHIKRQVEASKKILALSRDIIERIDIPADQDPDTRDTRDLYIRLITLYDSMSDNTNQLLTVYFSISSQRTNEVIRVLTLFSVFFMPLTFIVGIYGMNFRYMPEIDWKYGYPAVMLLMGIVTFIIYLWFKRKGWL